MASDQPWTRADEHAEDQSLPQYTRGHWRPSEDDKLKQLVAHHGPQNWNLIAQHLDGRSGKSCRLRWFNQLDPRINRAAFSADEEERLVAAHRLYGNKWACIARLFPGRTDNAVKNHWHVIMARHSRQAHQAHEAAPAAKRNTPFSSSSRYLMQFAPPPSHLQASSTQKSVVHSEATRSCHLHSPILHGAITKGEGKSARKKQDQFWFPLIPKRIQDEENLNEASALTMQKIHQTCKSWHLCDGRLLNKSNSHYMHIEQRGIRSSSNIEDFVQESTQRLTKEVPFIDFLGVGRV